MKIAIDTGFFIGYFEGRNRVMQLWQDFVANQHSMVVSTLVLNEVFAHCYRRGIADAAQRWLESLLALENVELFPVTAEIATDSARYRIGMHLSTVDSIILSTALLRQCDLLLTSDGDLNQPAIKNLIPVELISK